MGMSRFANRTRSGQMTVELAAAMPALIVVALIAVNACTFFCECAVFDRAAHEAVRTYAASPAYGQTPTQSCDLVVQSLSETFDADNLSVSVSHGKVGADFDSYTAVLSFYPTLFGRGASTSVFGVELAPITHSTTCVVDSYKPGVVV